jgi:hypothetical protein
LAPWCVRDLEVSSAQEEIVSGPTCSASLGSLYADFSGQLATAYRCQFTNTPDLRFRAVLTEGGIRKVEVARD